MIVARISLLRHYFFDQSGRGFPEAIHEQTQHDQGLQQYSLRLIVSCTCS